MPADEGTVEHVVQGDVAVDVVGGELDGAIGAVGLLGGLDGFAEHVASEAATAVADFGRPGADGGLGLGLCAGVALGEVENDSGDQLSSVPRAEHDGLTTVLVLEPGVPIRLLGNADVRAGSVANGAEVDEHNAGIRDEHGAEVVAHGLHAEVRDGEHSDEHGDADRVEDDIAGGDLALLGDAVDDELQGVCAVAGSGEDFEGELAVGFWGGGHGDGGGGGSLKLSWG